MRPLRQRRHLSALARRERLAHLVQLLLDAAVEIVEPLVEVVKRLVQWPFGHQFCPKLLGQMRDGGRQRAESVQVEGEPQISAGRHRPILSRGGWSSSWDERFRQAVRHYCEPV
jgi:hypothetical protein